MIGKQNPIKMAYDFDYVLILALLESIYDK